MNRGFLNATQLFACLDILCWWFWKSQKFGSWRTPSLHTILIFFRTQRAGTHGTELFPVGHSEFRIYNRYIFIINHPYRVGVRQMSQTSSHKMWGRRTTSMSQITFFQQPERDRKTRWSFTVLLLAGMIAATYFIGGNLFGPGSTFVGYLRWRGLAFDLSSFLVRVFVILCLRCVTRQWLKNGYQTATIATIATNTAIAIIATNTTVTTKLTTATTLATTITIVQTHMNFTMMRFGY